MFLALLIPLALYVVLVAVLDARGGVRTYWRRSAASTATARRGDVVEHEAITAAASCQRIDLSWTALDDMQVRRLLEQADDGS